LREVLGALESLNRGGRYLPLAVDSHRTHIHGKTDCRKRSEFVAYAVRTGLLTEEAPCSSA